MHNSADKNKIKDNKSFYIIFVAGYWAETHFVGTRISLQLLMSYASPPKDALPIISHLEHIQDVCDANEV